MGNTSKRIMWQTDFWQISLLSAEHLEFTMGFLITNVADLTPSHELIA